VVRVEDLRFEKGRTRFESDVNLNREQFLTGIWSGKSSKVLTATITDMGEENVRTKGCRLLLDTFQFVRLSRNRNQTTEAYSSFDLS
jgi:hypothetical protein